MLWGYVIPNTQAAASISMGIGGLQIPLRWICPSSVRRPGGFATRSAGYALSPVRRSGGFAIRRQKMT